MTTTAVGLHHVTAIAGDPQRNVDFYAGVLGLRLVKQTVNFDDPGSYHLYYGDATGRPGSIVTFFAWPGARRGRQGSGQVAVLSLSIPASSVGAWVERLVTSGVHFEGPIRRFDEQVISLKDPDGLLVELVADAAGDPRQPWTDGPVAAEHAVRGVHGVTIWSDADRGTGRVLADALGARELRRGDDGRARWGVGDGRPGELVDVREVSGFWAGIVAVGTIHHVAWRARDDAHQEELAGAVRRLGLAITEQVDRKYFRSMYFREPGGVLFELATDEPGFAVDEPAERIGARLMLPPWLEESRSQIEGTLPPIHLPSPARASAGAPAAEAAR
jgi:catechol 2,3-dioxygenase-like lactoylglutathione lyase family enzyme